MLNKLSIFEAENLLWIFQKKLSWPEVFEAGSSFSSFEVTTWGGFSLAVDVFLNLVKTCETFWSEEFQLLDGLSQEALSDKVVDESLVILFRVEPGEDFHRVNNIPLFLGPFPLKFLRSLKIKESSLNDKLFSSDPFVESGIV